MGLWDWVLLAALLLAVAGVLFWLYRRRARCGGGCGNCPYRDGCGKPGKRDT